MIYLKLLWSFLQVGLFSVGGGYAAMPLIQSQVVAGRGWLTMSEFTDLITIAEMTPGPIAVNSATFVGIRIAGLPGALTATLGCILPSLVLVSVLALVYRRYGNLNALQAILSCLRAAVIGLIAAAGLSILTLVVYPEQQVNLLGLALSAGAFALLRLRKWNPILVMCLCGLANLLAGTLISLI